MLGNQVRDLEGYWSCQASIFVLNVHYSLCSAALTCQMRSLSLLGHSTLVGTAQVR